MDQKATSSLFNCRFLIYFIIFWAEIFICITVAYKNVKGVKSNGSKNLEGVKIQT